MLDLVLPHECIPKRAPQSWSAIPLQELFQRLEFSARHQNRSLPCQDPFHPWRAIRGQLRGQNRVLRRYKAERNIYVDVSADLFIKVFYRAL